MSGQRRKAPSRAAKQGAGQLRSAADLVVALRGEIASLNYLEHDRLPSERALAHRYKVARGTVRAALTQLQQMGLVETRQGSGTYVRYSEMVETLSVVRLTSPMQLVDARLAVEPHVARLAALHGSGKAVYDLEAALRAVERCEEERDGFSTADERFHRAIAACTGNEMLIWICRWINEVRSHDQWEEMKRLTLTPARIAAYNVQHRAICREIRRRDAEGAAREVTAHLESARDSLVDVGGGVKGGGT